MICGEMHIIVKDEMVDFDIMRIKLPSTASADIQFCAVYQQFCLPCQSLCQFSTDNVGMSPIRCFLRGHCIHHTSHLLHGLSCCGDMEAYCAAYLCLDIYCTKLPNCIMIPEHVVGAITEHSLHDALQTRSVESRI